MMTVGTFATGDMSYLRRPFVHNVKRGDRVLVISDTSHDACTRRLRSGDARDTGISRVGT
jgi:hypothetical protein